MSNSLPPAGITGITYRLGQPVDLPERVLFDARSQLAVHACNKSSKPTQAPKEGKERKESIRVRIRTTVYRDTPAFSEPLSVEGMYPDTLIVYCIYLLVGVNHISNTCVDIWQLPPDGYINHSGQDATWPSADINLHTNCWTEGDPREGPRCKL